MRHRNSIRKLGVKTAHRKAMMSNMAVSLLDHGQIKTTLSRAKVLVPTVSRLITWAKKGDVHSRRLAASKLNDKKILGKLFNEIGPEFQDRNGGYARILKNGTRRGDGASMAIVQLLIEKKVEEKSDKKGKKDKKEKKEKTEAKAKKEKPAKKEAK
jgi:large subunit ribosomal protein L17